MAVLSNKDIRRQNAQSELNTYIAGIQKAMDNFKAQLASSNKPEVTSPTWLHSYDIKMWANKTFPPNGWMTPKTELIIAVKKLGLPEDYRQLVYYKVSHEAHYIPTVHYQLIAPTPSYHSKGRAPKTGLGIPCLEWRLAVYIISVIEFWEREGTINWEWNEFHNTLRFTGENLGKMYAGPEFWSYQTAFITPISLLAQLCLSPNELPGVEVLSRNPPWNSYRVDRFEGDISLHDDFKRFIGDMVKKTMLDKALLNRGMCDEETAALIKAKLEKIQKSEPPAPVSQATGGDDYSDLVEALKGLNYTQGEATKAAKQVFQQIPKETLENKVKLAMHYLSP